MMAGVTVKRDDYGTLSDGRPVSRFTFANKNNMTVRVINFGGIITDVLFPDKNGKIEDVSLGFDNIEGYEKNEPYFGAICGRVANVISNGKFTLEGKEYSIGLNFNDGVDTVHGGFKGFNKVLWDAHLEGEKLVLKYTSKDGEEGFPGEVTTTITYELSENNELKIDYTATTTKPSPVNLTNHVYFNLAGQGYPNIDDHLITITADKYTPVSETFIPTGEISDVKDSLFDLRQPVRLGDRMKIINKGTGYCTNFCIGETKQMKHFATLEHPASGRVVEAHTTEPGVQFYTGCNMVDNLVGKGGKTYVKYNAVCLETQHYPDAVNQSNFPSIIVKPGETYRHTTIYKFVVKK